MNDNLKRFKTSKVFDSLDNSKQNQFGRILYYDKENKAFKNYT